jgi:hypothetical protein
MQKLEKLEVLFATVALAAVTTVSGNAYATPPCGTNAGPGGQTTVPCPSPGPSPSPAPGTVINGGAGGAGGAGGNGGNGGAGGAGGAGGRSDANAEALAQQAQLQGQQQGQSLYSLTHSQGGNVRFGNGSLSPTSTVGDTRATVGNTTATVGDTRATVGNTAATGGTATNGNQTLSTTTLYEAARRVANSAYAPSLGTSSSGDGKLSRGGFSVGVQTYGGGITGGYQLGEKFDQDHANFILKRDLVRSGTLPGVLPAMAVTAVLMAGGETHLARLRTKEGQEEMRLFAAPAVEDSGVQGRSASGQSSTAPAPQGNIALNQHFYGATTTTQEKFVCVLPKRGDATKTEEGIPKVINGVMACTYKNG